MKKILVISLMLALCGQSAMAQKGRDGIGGNIAWNLYNDSGFGLGVKYQYNLSDNVRLEPSFNFYPTNTMPDRWGHKEGCYTWLLNANLHYLIGKPNRWRTYIIGGLALGNMKGHDEKSYGYYDEYGYYDGYSESVDVNKTKIGINAGLGFDYRITYALSLQMEPKIILQNTITLAPTIGLTYYFK